MPTFFIDHYHYSYCFRQVPLYPQNHCGAASVQFTCDPVLFGGMDKYLNVAQINCACVYIVYNILCELNPLTIPVKTGHLAVKSSEKNYANTDAILASLLSQ